MSLKNPNWFDRNDRDLYNQLFTMASNGYNMEEEEWEFCKRMYHMEEVAERDKEFCDKCDGDIEIDCVDCHEGGRALLAKEILQKISEVINES